MADFSYQSDRCARDLVDEQLLQEIRLLAQVVADVSDYRQPLTRSQIDVLLRVSEN